MSTPSTETTPAAATTPPAAPAAEAEMTPEAAAAAAAAAAAEDEAARLSASLYVGDLDRDVNEATLFEVFKQVGPVASIRVCRDAVTRRSLGYAYVNFHTSPDDHVSFAERALDTLNYTLIKSKPCRIMWSHRDPSVRKSGVGNVFIKNMNKDIDNKALYDTFSTFGNILSCKVATDEHGNSKGYGFVHYETQEAADNAIAQVNEKSLNGKVVYVGPFIPRKERTGDSSERKFTNVYIKNLEATVSEEDLKGQFSKFGEITNCVVMASEDSKSKGFGFINFATPEEARAAVEEMNGKEIKGKAIYVGRAQKKAEREAELKDKFEKIKLEQKLKWQGVNLFVKNLDDNIDDEKLKSEFTVYGSITSAKVMRDDKGNSKGFGFVCYSKPEEATKAVTEMNGRMFGSKPIYVALAQRKEERRAQLEAQYAQRARPMGGLMQHVAAPAGASMAGSNQIYPPGAPMFYQGVPQQRQGYVYPQSVVPRPRWGNHMPSQQGMPVQQRQQRGGRGQRAPQQGGRGGQAGGQNARPRYKINPNARNQQARPDHNAPVEGFVAPEPLNSSTLAQASPEERKQMLGESLFPLIAAQEPTQAGKITGMLLESIPDGELLLMIDDAAALEKKIKEALLVLKNHERNVSEDKE